MYGTVNEEEAKYGSDIEHDDLTLKILGKNAVFNFSPPFWWTIKLKLQALVYDILHPTTATTGYDIGLKKPSDGQFLVGAQMAIHL